MQKLLKIPQVAIALSLSEHTIRQSPSNFGMFKVGGLWRATQSDIDNYIDEARKNYNNAKAPTLDKRKKGVNKCRYSRGTASITSISARQAVSELDARLKQETGKQRKNCTIN